MSALFAGLALFVVVGVALAIIAHAVIKMSD